MEQKTIAIGELWHPLEVEWNTYTPHVRMTDGSFRQVESHKVTLVIPGMRFLSEEPRRTRLVDFSPKTALNLLAWLEQEREILEQLVKEEEEQMGE